MSGVVLAGGASRRMGVDKATLRHPSSGSTLLDHAAAVLAGAGATPVVVATGTAGRLGPLPHLEVDDGEEHRGAGPLAGILAALRSSPTSVVAVVAVDLPHASAELLRDLRDLWDPGTDTALVPLDPQGRPQPLHALWSTALAPAIDEALRRGERRVRHVLDGQGARTVVPRPQLARRPWATNHNQPSPAAGE